MARPPVSSDFNPSGDADEPEATLEYVEFSDNSEGITLAHVQESKRPDRTGGNSSSEE